MNIKITADSTCDLSKELLARYNISTVPLTVIKAGEMYLDGVNITPQDIFAHVDQGGDLCTTSAVNSENYREFFAKILEDYDAIVHISIGSGFSSCYQNANIAAANFSNVYVVDSMNLSTGQGHLVIEAAQLAQKGMIPAEIKSQLDAMRNRVSASFIMDRLDYMQKGGRCSAVIALGGKLLKIKPCIAVQNGSMGMVDKQRGNYAKCIEKYIKEMLKDRDDIRTDRVFITHTPVDDEALQIARETVEKYGNFDEIFETDAGCTVSCHCGPGTLGVLFITK